MEDNYRKGPGVFYAVVGVATLVVAIIGATFAFFTASDVNETINGTTASSAGIQLKVIPLTSGTEQNLIPVEIETEAGNQFAAAVSSTKGKGVCKDSNGNNVCAAYRLIISNTSDTSTLTVSGNLSLKVTKTVTGENQQVTTEGTDDSNIKWKLIKATVTGDGDNLTMTDAVADTENTNIYSGISAHPTTSEEMLIAPFTTTNPLITNKVVLGNTTTESHTLTYDVLIWLEETGSSQEGEDASLNWNGKVFFSAVDAVTGATSGITATFDA